MKFEGFKSVWLDEKRQSSGPSSLSVSSQSLKLLRLTAIRDWERSREKARVIFSLLFALLVVLAAFAALPSGTSPIVALLFAAALMIEGVTESILVARKNRDSSSSMYDYIAREHRDATSRFRLARKSQVSLLILTAVALVLVVGGPRPSESPAREIDGVASMLIMTAFLLIAWLRARSVAWTRQVSQELEGHLRELASQKM